MAEQLWIAVGRDGADVSAYAVSDTSVAGQARGKDEAAALAGLRIQAKTIVRIGEGAPGTVPCEVLPAKGVDLPVITQDHPPDVLDAWVRLWIAGFLASNANWDGVVWVCGRDASHWVHVSAGEIISFAGFLTPRLVAVLKGAVTPCAAALSDTMSRPARLAAHLRQAELSGDRRAITGHLLGAELAAARVYWLGQRVALITPCGDASGYGAALEAQGVPVSTCMPEDVIEDGLASLGAALGLGD